MMRFKVGDIVRPNKENINNGNWCFHDECRRDYFDISKPFVFDIKNSKLVTVDVNKTIKAKTSTPISIIADIKDNQPEGEFSLHIGGIDYANEAADRGPIMVKGETMSVKVAPKPKPEPAPKVSLKLSDASPKNVELKAGDKNKLLSIFQLNTDQNITLTEFKVQSYVKAFGMKLNMLGFFENSKLNLALFQNIDKPNLVNSEFIFNANNTIPSGSDYPISFITDIKDSAKQEVQFNMYAVSMKYKDSKGKEYTLDLSTTPVVSHLIKFTQTTTTTTTNNTVENTDETIPKVNTPQMVLKKVGPTFSGEYYYWEEKREVSLYIDRANFKKYNSAKISTYACPEDFLTYCFDQYSCNLRYASAAKDKKNCDLKEYTFENYPSDLNYELVWPNWQGTTTPVLTRQLSKISFYNKDDSTIQPTIPQFISIWINKFNIPQDYSELKITN